MSKKRPQRRSESVHLLPGVFVENVRAFAKECDAIVAKAAGLKFLKFSETIETHVRKRYDLSGTEVIPIEGDRPYKAVQVYESTETKYWLAPSMKFESLEGKEYLTSLSLVIFSGNMTEEKVPLLRAEWDCNPAGKKQPSHDRPHAQPHWHVYSSRFQEASLQVGQFDTNPAVEEFAPQGTSTSQGAGPRLVWQEGEDFHFAMLALWSKEGRLAHYNSAESEELIKWLEGCIHYMLAQLRYISDKGKTEFEVI